MSSDRNVEVVQRIYEAFERRDLDAALELCDPNAELWPPVTARLASRGEPYRGHDGIRRYFADVEQVWGELVLLPREFRPIGDCVLVLGRIMGRRATTFYLEAGWLWRLRHGKAVSCHVYESAQAALDAAEEEANPRRRRRAR